MAVPAMSPVGPRKTTTIAALRVSLVVVVFTISSVATTAEKYHGRGSASHGIASQDALHQSYPIQGCHWTSGNATLECEFGLSAPDDALRKASRLAPGDQRSVETLRLQCFHQEEEEEKKKSVGRGSEIPKDPSLRDILDQAISLVERQRDDLKSSTSPWDQLKELEFLDCFFQGRLGRIDLLFIASSFSMAGRLERIKISSAADESKSLSIDDASVFTDAPRGLTHLDLSFNSLSSFPARVFCPLRNDLVTLNLSSNGLEKISDIGLGDSERMRGCQLARLESLSIANNDLRSLPLGSFAGLVHLRTLDLSHNKIGQVAGNVLDRENGLQVLNLAHNRLERVPSDILGDGDLKLPLAELYLAGNNLTHVPASLLHRMSNLVLLNLSRNALGSNWLRKSPFSGLESLVALDLSHNRLTSLGERDFAGLASLQVLTVAFNQIHSASEAAFSGLNLHALVLSNNDLEDVPVGLFHGLDNLNSLTLDHNGIKTLHRDVFANCCLSLQDLALHSNSFRHIPHPALHPLAKSLRSLDLGENQIVEVHQNALAGLSDLRGLRLAGNWIKRLSEKVFEEANNIRMLNLADNQLETIVQDAFMPLKNLKALRLDNNQLEEINGLLTTQLELQWLNVSHNRLQWFDYAFIPKSLVWLNMANNEIEELQNYYEMLEGFQLVHLDVSVNRLTRLDRQMLMKSLKEIHVNDNLISELAPNTFTGMSNLTHVNLAENKLSKFSLNSLALSVNPTGRAKIQGKPEFFVDLLLAGNPLVCDCEMEWMQRINELALASPREFPRVVDWTEITCGLNNRFLDNSGGRFAATSNNDGEKGANATSTGGGPMLTLPLSKVEPREFICEYETHCFALCMCCDFFACDCRMKCSDGCSCYHDQTWTDNIIQCGGRQHSRVPKFIPMDATSIYLDGNNLKDLSDETFIGRKHLTSLYLNHSNVEVMSNKTLSGLDELLVLHLNHNMLSALNGGELSDLRSLRELRLDHNRLVFLNELAFGNLVSLKVLTLDHNQLASFPIWNLFSLHSLTVSGNPWSCDCGFLRNVQHFLRQRPDRVPDGSSLTCVLGDGIRNSIGNASCADVLAVSFRDKNNGHNFKRFPTGMDDDESAEGEEEEEESRFWDGIVPIVAIMSSAFIIVISLIALAIALRKPIKTWLVSNRRQQPFRPENFTGSSNANSRFDAKSGGVSSGIMVPAPCNANTRYDAYIHYDPGDGALVENDLVSIINEGSPSGDRHLFLHHRDFTSKSRSLSDAISAVLDSSDKIVLVSTRDYLLNEIAQNELRIITECAALTNRSSNSIIVLTTCSEDLKETKSVMARYRECIFLSIAEVNFSCKLRQALQNSPHHNGSSIPSGKGNLYPMKNFLKWSSEPEDDMWTYVEANVENGGGSSSCSTTGGGQDSSQSTHSTTDISNGTFPASSRSNVLQQLEEQMGKRPHQSSTMGNRSHVIVNPMQSGRTTGGAPSSSLVGFHRNALEKGQKRGAPTWSTLQQRSSGGRLRENPLDSSSRQPLSPRLASIGDISEDGDSDYMSVSDSLSRPPNKSRSRRRQGRSMKSNLEKEPREPIYHTLEPPMPNALVSHAGGDDKGDMVYINDKLELVYPTLTPRDQHVGPFPTDPHYFDTLLDEDDELLPDGVNVKNYPAYVSSPAPSSVPRSPFLNSSPLPTHHQFKQTAKSSQRKKSQIAYYI